MTDTRQTSLNRVTTPAQENTPQAPLITATTPLVSIFQAIKEADLLAASNSPGDINAAIQVYTQAIQHPRYGSIKCYKNRANANMRLQRYNEALHDFQRYLSSYPNDADAYIEQAQVLYKQGNLSPAIALLENGLKQMNSALDTRKIQVYLSWCYTQQGNYHKKNDQYPQALLSYTIGLQHDPENANLHCSLGVLLQDKRNYPDAMSHFKKAIELAPNHGMAYFYIGNIYAEKIHTLAGAFEASKKYYLLALHHAPHLHGVHMNLGALYFDHKEYSSAILAFTEAIELSSDLPLDQARIYINRASAWQNLGELEKAAQDFQRALSLEPKAELASRLLAMVYNEQATALIKQERYSEALDKLNAALALNPENNHLKASKKALLQVLEVRAKQKQAQGQNQLAIVDFKQILLQDPSWTAINNNLAECYYAEALLAFQNKDYTAALSLFENTFQLQPENVPAYFHYAHALVRSGRAAEAPTYFQKCLSIQPHFAEAHNDLGVTLKNLEFPLEEVIACYEKAISHCPNLSTAYYNLAKNYADLKNYRKAVENYKLAQLKPDDQEAQDSLETTYDLLYEQALQDLVQGACAQAALDLAIVVEARPLNADAQYNCGLASYLAGQFRTALSYLENAVRLDAHDHIISYYTGLCHYKLDQFADAEKHLSSIAALNPSFFSERGVASLLNDCHRQREINRNPARWNDTASSQSQQYYPGHFKPQNRNKTLADNSKLPTPTSSYFRPR